MNTSRSGLRKGMAATKATVAAKMRGRGVSAGLSWWAFPTVYADCRVASAHCSLEELIWADGLPAGLNQATFASMANTAARRHRTIPNAVTRECRRRSLPRID
jgi:hypothetical protein